MLEEGPGYPVYVHRFSWLLQKLGYSDIKQLEKILLDDYNLLEKRLYKELWEVMAKEYFKGWWNPALELKLRTELESLLRDMILMSERDTDAWKEKVEKWLQKLKIKG